MTVPASVEIASATALRNGILDKSHKEVTWEGIQNALKDCLLFTSLSLPERKRLHQVLSRLRIQYDWYDIDIEAEAGTDSQITALERLRRCFWGIAEVRNETTPTVRGVIAAMEHAARERARAVNSRISELQAAVDGLHARASSTGRITKKQVAEMRRLVALLSEEHRSLPFEPADPSAPFLFVNRLINDASAAVPIVRDAKKYLAARSNEPLRPQRRLSAIEWLGGVALREVYESFSQKEFSLYISDKRPSPGLSFVRQSLYAMNIAPEGGRSKGGLYSAHTLKALIRAARKKREQGYTLSE